MVRESKLCFMRNKIKEGELESNRHLEDKFRIPVLVLYHLFMLIFLAVPISVLAITKTPTWVKIVCVIFGPTFIYLILDYLNDSYLFNPLDPIYKLELKRYNKDLRKKDFFEFIYWYPTKAEALNIFEKIKYGFSALSFKAILKQDKHKIIYCFNLDSVKIKIKKSFIKTIKVVKQNLDLENKTNLDYLLEIKNLGLNMLKEASNLE